MDYFPGKLFRIGNFLVIIYIYKDIFMEIKKPMDYLQDKLFMICKILKELFRLWDIQWSYFVSKIHIECIPVF